MNDTELTALLARDLPPASDAKFTLAVLARMEQRRFHREVATTMALAAAAVLLLVLLAPVLDIFWRDSFAPFASDAVIAMTLLILTITVPQFFTVRND